MAPAPDVRDTLKWQECVAALQPLGRDTNQLRLELDNALCAHDRNKVPDALDAFDDLLCFKESGSFRTLLLSMNACLPQGHTVRGDEMLTNLYQRTMNIRARVQEILIRMNILKRNFDFIARQ